MTRTSVTQTSKAQTLKTQTSTLPAPMTPTELVTAIGITLTQLDQTLMEPGKSGDSANSRPADVPSNVNPKTTKDAAGNYFQAIHAQP